jgi:hypothetical protein
MFLVNSRLHQFTVTHLSYDAKSSPSWAPLIPKLRGNFAEFLFHGSLEHLRLLASSTCVGLRYGRYKNSLRGFSWQFFRRVGLPQAARFLRSLEQYAADLPTAHSTLPNNHIRQVALHISCVPPSVKRFYIGQGILTLFPSTTPFGLALGAD